MNHRGLGPRQGIGGGAQAKRSTRLWKRSFAIGGEVGLQRPEGAVWADEYGVTLP